MSQIDTNVLLFTYCIMMVVKMAAKTAIIKYVLVNVWRTYVILISSQATLFSAFSVQ